jgi:FkbM family methyltransferase
MGNFFCENKRTSLLGDLYNHFQDETSKDLFKARLMCSFCDDNTYMDEMIKNMAMSKLLLQELDNHESMKKVLFGAGTWGGILLRLFDIKWDYVVDNNKAGQEIDAYSISSLTDIADISECYFVIAMTSNSECIVEQLKNLGVKKEYILILEKIKLERIYFDLPELKLSQEETFLDVGAFHGETSLQFAKVTKGQYKNIYLFEPSETLAVDCMANTAKLENSLVIKKATWNSSQRINFVECNECSHLSVDENEDLAVETITIDELLAGEKATYIKMDIEGAELESIMGAEKTIRNHKPKLAISVYHKRDDIWEIPMLLLEYNPEYKFYLRVYTFTGADTVLYAI